MKPALILAFLTLAACSDPALHAGISLDSSGVSVYPAVSGRVGGATVSVSP
ncbi:hypothetical protein [Pseudothioclava nitratireducens]|jgi:hypothetical protein|uniref:hypothetical protein n=1 Tax=Pseudothioclava nitratireducens TaxID=1928646 RepID=UPI0023DBC2A6|nr:hypothetical protein [Defluviimonas nitratireducens]MDF1620876.1 hypothetical protein [Defluviimonas nitratireducens]